MNKIHAYEGISRSEIIKPRCTSSGKEYSLNHPRELIVSMRYTPIASNKNPQGWESDQKAYWAAIRERCPQCLDYKNRKLIECGSCPRVNKTFSDYFPQYKEFQDQKLFHHHIGGNGDAVAVPIEVHKGFGEIHNIEKQLTIRDNAEQYSRECRSLCAKDQKLYGKTSIEFQKLLSHEKNQVMTASDSRSNVTSSVSDNKTLVDKKLADQMMSKELQNHQDKIHHVPATQGQDDSPPSSTTSMGNDKKGKISRQLTQFRRDHGEPGTTLPAAHDHNITPENERASVREQIRDNQNEHQNKIIQEND